MTIGDVYRASMVFTHPEGEGDLVTTMHYRTTIVNTTVSGVLEAFDIGTELVNDVENNYLPDLSNSFIFTGVTVIGITDPLVGITVNSGNAGQVVSEALALRSAVVVKLQTGLRGRSFNGRSFLMAPAEDDQASGVLSLAYQAIIDLFMIQIRQMSVNANMNTYSSTVFSKTLTGEFGPIVDNLITNSVTNPTLGSQRGRQKVN